MLLLYPPKARIELEIGYNKSINRETRILGVGDNLFYVSQEMEQYKGFSISEIDPLHKSVTFTNGETIYANNVVGDVSEQDMRRIQIRETIISHFEKEEKLFNKGIKTLSLFFIDEVAKYRQYDENGDEVLGEYGKIFEEEYLSVLQEYRSLLDTPYQKYLNDVCLDEHAVHRGYFSIDKKTGRSVNSELKRGSEFSDDISAYDLILKNKERLLSFEEPTRFIFSHSALREGWDNPNVFQICTLRHTDSTTAKRQEVGRGLRLCVDSTGNRMDAETCGDVVHDINVLTVIANESYKNFVSDLQKDIKDMLYDRPLAATSEYFKGKFVKVDGVPTQIDGKMANGIEFYLIANGYVDMLIPRGGTGLIRACIENATVPCIQTGTGICHIYVDRSADIDKALDIIENAKTSRPSVCNAAEVCLVDADIAREFLPRLKERLSKVELRLDQRAAEIIDGTPAGENDFDTEFLDYVLAVAVVDRVEEAVKHIAKHSTSHSEAIIAEDKRAQEIFTSAVDSAAVYVNASTRFTDGGEFGFGCEMGISTQKLHARGPMGLPELTTYKYVISGNGQVR